MNRTVFEKRRRQGDNKIHFDASHLVDLHGDLTEKDDMIRTEASKDSNS